MNVVKRIGSCSKDCYGGCVFEGEWDDESPEHKLLATNPMKGHPFTQGVFCPKLQRRQDLIYHEKRLKHPLIRNGSKSSNQYTPLSIDSALTKIAEKIESVQNKFGHSAILGAYYSGNSMLISQQAPLRFFNAIRGTITTGGICNEGGNEGLKQLFGTYSTTNPFQLADPSTKLIVIWGSNLSDTNNHAYLFVKKALRNGAILVVIDSRRTQIAREAHYYLPIFPGTEHLVAILLLKYLFQKNILDKPFIDAQVEGFSHIQEQLDTIDESDFYQKLDLTPKSIEELGELMIKFSHQTLFSIGFSVQKDYFGGQIVQNLALIQILMGNLGLPGTGIIFSQSDFNHQFVDPLVKYITKDDPQHPIPLVQLIELGSVLDSGKYKILIVWNFNPANSLPNQNLVRQALSRDDLFVVVLDLFENDTTKYADIIIPAKFDVETDDLLTPYYIPGLSINEAGPCPYPECVSNWEFFQLLGKKLGYKNPRFDESQSAIQKHAITLLPSAMQSNLKSKGYSILFKENDIPYSDYIYPTASRKILLQPIQLNFGIDEIKKKFSRKSNEYLLITPSHPQLLHSQLSEIHPETESFVDKIFISPKDLHAGGLEAGEMVEVSNEFHKTDYFLSVSTQLKPGVAMIYKGLKNIKDPSKNANYFTPNRPECLGKSGSYNSALITIKKKSK